ncbi:hypothetical protein L1987_08906 [Smallanthus sonchifolius]|uniref:Uncharacterized protein n=1 Tax=Smallanthus sonchifolius TaxID=185202 RepID=A0ACB9JLZ5_9ASTR|nr:hypothetical protein L1987_08906 [Smallanthus sonchifolius]
MKIVSRENVSVNIEEKKYQVRVNQFASWVPSFNKIEEYGSNDEVSSKNGDGDSVETQSNERSFGRVVQESGNEFNKEVLNLKSDLVDVVNLEDVTLVVNDKSKVDQVTIVSEHVEHVAVELVVPSFQEAINKVVVDVTVEVVNDPQETIEAPVMSPSTPPAVEDLKNIDFKSFTSDLEVNVAAGCDNGSSSGMIPKGGTHVF